MKTDFKGKLNLEIVDKNKTEEAKESMESNLGKSSLKTPKATVF